MQLIESTDLIEVSHVPLLFVGPPGCGKTSLSQTAATPLTLDFDEGLHRAANRRTGGRFKTWGEVVHDTQAGCFAKFQTLVIDTGGRALDLLMAEVIKESPTKQPWAYRGALTKPGWGELGRRFVSWMKLVRSLGKDVVMVCHQDEKQNKMTDVTELKADLAGGMAWKEIHKSFDCIGRICYDGRQRLLNFTPSEEAPFCKDAGQLGIVPVPELHTNTSFLADLITKAKHNLGHTAEQSAKAAAIVSEWQTWLDSDPALELVNGRLPEIKTLGNGIRAQVWHLVEAKLTGAGYVFNKKSKAFVAKEAA